MRYARHVLRLFVAFIVLSALFGVELGPAYADAIENRARAHFEAGRSFYQLESYREALHEFAAGYTLVPQPLFLVDMGQAHRHMHENERALAMFRRFLVVAPPTDENRPMVQALIEQLEKEEVRGQEQPTRASPAPTVIAQSDRVAPTPSAGRALRIAGLTSGLLGVGFIVAGGTLLGLVPGQRNLIQSPSPGWMFDPSVEKRQDLYNGLGIAFTSVGIAAATVGAAVGVVGLRKRSHGDSR